MPRTAIGPGPPSGSARTSSRRPGEHSRSCWSLACSTQGSRKSVMAAPKSAPVGSNYDVRTYGSPDAVPAPWAPDRPAEIHGRQPMGDQLGYQGPDQGYVL